MAKIKRAKISPDLTPLIDVVFILLIFFMVTSVFKTQELALDLNLASSSSNILKKQPKDISIELSQSKLALDGKIISISQLTTNITKIDNKTIVLFRIDENVKYKRFIEILDILKKYNFDNINLITKKLD